MRDNVLATPLKKRAQMKIYRLVVGLGEDHPLEFRLKELHGVCFLKFVWCTYLGLALAALGNTEARALKHDEEVHA